MGERRLVLVTGASSGIGAEFARQYAMRGWDIALTARRADRLDALAIKLEEKYKVATFVIPQDLARASSVDAILKTLKSEGRHLDGVVNNAGYGPKEEFLETKWKEHADFIRVLYTVPIELTHKVLPGMVERGFGRIINVASLAGYAPGTSGLYASVKTGLIRFSEAVHAELRADGHDSVNCTALCPGLTESEFHDVNGTREQFGAAPEWMWMQARPVVEAGISACEHGRPVVVPGAVNKGLATLSRLLPEPVTRILASEQAQRLKR